MTGAHSGRVQIIAASDTDSVIISTAYTNANRVNPSLVMPAAIAGILTTRTSNTQGIVTSVAHGLTTADVVALFWTGGYCYDCEITAYDDDTITFTAAAGDNLPIEDTALTVATAQTVEAPDVYLPGLGMELIFVKVTSIASNGLVVFYSMYDSEVFSEEVSTTAPYIWPIGSEARPFEDIVTKMTFYNGALNSGIITVVAQL